MWSVASHKTNGRITNMLCSLRDKALDLVRKRGSDLPLERIASDTGLSYEWLRKFVTGRIPDPSVNKAETLYTYLSGRKLDLGD